MPLTLADVNRKEKIAIGIPCYGDVDPMVFQDYLRMMFHFGRRYSEFDFELAFKTKSEQFRARNAMAEAALVTGCDYLLMLDDDNVFDILNSPGSEPYEFLRKLLRLMKEKERCGICGALYFQRGGHCSPVLMKELNGGGHRFLNDSEITGQPQLVDVQGGGVILIRRAVLEQVPQPWFVPEVEKGTDIQICVEAAKLGWEIWSDTGIEVGHVVKERQVVSRTTRHRFISNAIEQQGMLPEWENQSRLRLMLDDAMEYTGLGKNELFDMAENYNYHMATFPTVQDEEKLREYYAKTGVKQLARQLLFHSLPRVMDFDNSILKLFDTANGQQKIVDFGCGSAPVTFELLLRGHKVHFVDVDGAGGYEFVKWRIKRRGKERDGTWGWIPWGKVDVVTFFDSLEHLLNWEGVLEDVATALRVGGAILTNFFENQDVDNVEHVNMNKGEVSKKLIELGFYPICSNIWIKKGGEDGVSVSNS
jgi:2-polyprenyl-3-methyl-5-hydroxy-6-metoxy-1,4-benzoquinol methylase